MKKDNLKTESNKSENLEPNNIDNNQIQEPKRRRSGNSKKNNNLGAVIFIGITAIICIIVFLFLNKEDKQEVPIEDNFKEISYKKVEQENTEQKTSVQEEILQELNKQKSDKVEQKADVTDTLTEDKPEATNSNTLLGDIGSSLEVNNIKYTLLDYNVEDSIGVDTYKIDAEEGSKLLLFDLKIENIGTEDVYLNFNNLYAVPNNNVQYGVSYFIASNEYIGLHLDAIIPESDKYVKMYVEVPEEYLKTDLNLNINSKDSSEIATFKIELSE